MHRKLRSWFERRGSIVVGVAFAIVFGLALILSAEFRRIMACPITASWAAALGTFAAAVVSLRVAFWSRKVTKLEAMTEGAFELVAADYLVSKMQNETRLFSARLTERNRTLDEIERRIDSFRQEVERIESSEADTLTNAEQAAQRLEWLERRIEVSEWRSRDLTAEWGAEFGPYSELLESQLMQISHVRAAAFNPAAGLAVIRAKAMARRLNSLVRSHTVRKPLAEDLAETLTQLSAIGAYVDSAEQYIGRVSETYDPDRRPQHLH